MERFGSTPMSGSWHWASTRLTRRCASDLKPSLLDLTQRLIGVGTSVILEWGFWARSERDELREFGRSLGARVELHFLDVPFDELVRRLSPGLPSAASQSPPITWSGIDASSSPRQTMS